ncbi:MAG TPA: Crp/Fnr family transcriptional regulator [Amycolatopsis sp.]|uniref:Crp/Fnr family transcriptional regulator n=1 Tax=Amycolatopsis sp. TaxID=37632 RepID=UPI002B478814|nr:Crp/Fnr family transcriptional regulator [Amycolatopsis sp.]HKS48495.1 Crp/Fnr family transcriptional regulator [Amycolatopsis sp.]
MAAGDFWGMLDQTQRDTIRAAARVRRFPAGTMLMSEGDRARSVLVLLTGWVKVTSSGPGGHEAVLNVCGPGDIVGEIAAVDGGPRSGAVIAVDAVTAFWLSVEQFSRILRQHPDIAVIVSRVISGKLRAADARRRQFADRTTAGRIVELLADLAERYGVSTSDGVVVALRISQQDIAGMVSASREAAARTLRALREAGVISTARRRLTIHRPDALRTFAD